jgi:DNA-binding MarR family transcriptional regulator
MSDDFTPQLLGQTEKTLNAILAQTLDGDVTEPEWVALIVAGDSSELEGRVEVDRRVAAALKTPTAAGHKIVQRLLDKGLLEAAGPTELVSLTNMGRRFVGRVRGEVGEITRRLWGDLPADDLRTTARVLAAILARAEAELATSGAL